MVSQNTSRQCVIFHIYSTCIGFKKSHIGVVQVVVFDFPT